MLTHAEPDSKSNPFSPYFGGTSSSVSLTFLIHTRLHFPFHLRFMSDFLSSGLLSGHVSNFISSSFPGHIRPFISGFISCCVSVRRWFISAFIFGFISARVSAHFRPMSASCPALPLSGFISMFPFISGHVRLLFRSVSFLNL